MSQCKPVKIDLKDSRGHKPLYPWYADPHANFWRTVTAKHERQAVKKEKP